MTTSSDRVVTITEKIPPGRVAAYWDLARYAGNPHAWGAAGSAIHPARDDRNQRVPWWRTVSYLGKITPSRKNGQEQARRLREEGRQV